MLFCFFLIVLFNALGYGYEVEFLGDAPAALFKEVEQHSLLKLYQDKPPSSSLALEQRMEADREQLVKLLQLEGYFQAKVFIEKKGEFPWINIEVHVVLGPLYHLRDAIVEPEMLREPLVGVCFRDSIDCYEKALIERFQKQGYPFVKIIKKQLLVTDQEQLVDVLFLIDSGPKAYFGPVSIVGLKQVHETFVKKMITWKEHSLYDPEEIQATEHHLRSSALFVSTYTELGIPQDSILPITLHLTEAPLREVAIGLSYASDRGVSMGGEWHHRNMTGRGDHFNCMLETAWFSTKSSLSYHLPYLPQKREVIIGGEWIRDKKLLNPYRYTYSCFVKHLHRYPSHHLCYGIQYEKLYSTRYPTSIDSMWSLPIEWTWARERDHFFDLGLQLGYECVPYYASSLKNSFIRQKIYLSKVFNPFKNGFIKTAFFASSIYTHRPDDVPLSKRIYFGSSCELKGYKYLTVSPFTNGKPTGGFSCALLDIELYLPLKDEYYLSPFLSLGNVYASQLPRLQKPLKSIGVGGCYHTALGLLRLDIAVALNKREDIDPPFQIYFSMGKRL